MRFALVFIVLIFSCLFAKAQDNFYTKTGHIYFMSHTDAIDIDGNNKQVASFINIKTGEVVFAVLIKSFEFTLATAYEHFNETYMESHKFQKASYKGKIKDIEKVDLTKNGSYEVTVEGKLTIHGVTKDVVNKALLKVVDGKITAASNFKVNISDYDIKVPKVVEDRVAKTVDVKVDANYVPYK